MFEQKKSFHLEGSLASERDAFLRTRVETTATTDGVGLAQEPLRRQREVLAQSREPHFGRRARQREFFSNGNKVARMELRAEALFVGAVSVLFYWTPFVIPLIAVMLGRFAQASFYHHDLAHRVQGIGASAALSGALLLALATVGLPSFGLYAVLGGFALGALIPRFFGKALRKLVRRR